MIDSSLASILTGAGACGVFCVLFILGIIYPRSVVTDLKSERDAERARADAERDRADTAVAAAQATRDLMAALQAGVTMGQQAGTRAVHGGSPPNGGKLRTMRIFPWKPRKQRKEAVRSAWERADEARRRADQAAALRHDLRRMAADNGFAHAIYRDITGHA